MSSFTGSFSDAGDKSRDSYSSYDPHFPSQRFQSQRLDSFSDFSDSDPAKEAAESPPYGDGGDVFASQPVVDTPLPGSIYAAGDGFSPELNGGAAALDGPILPPPVEMQPEEGFALGEWRRQNAIRLEEKEKMEREFLREIIEQAEEYKAEFYSKWKVRSENNRTSNREKEKLYLESREKFHAEASTNYFKTIAELIPNEVPVIEKKGKKVQEKKPSVVVIQGPKPGKPTDLSRMCQVLVRLKHNPPSHMKPPPKPSSEPGNDAKTGPSPPAATAPAKPVPKAGSEALAAA